LALPVVNSYIIGPGDGRRLWQVAAVVFDGEAVDVFVVEVSPILAGELTAAWAAWDKPATVADGRGDGT